VTVSYFEWVQNLQYYRWGLNRVRQELEAVLTRAFDLVWQEAKLHKCSLRTAAYIIAIRRVKSATAPPDFLAATCRLASAVASAR